MTNWKNDYKRKQRLFDLNVNNRLISKKSRQKFLEQWKRDEEITKADNKKKARKRTLLRNIEKKKMWWYATFTFNRNNRDSTDLKAVEIALNKFLRYHHIDYQLYPELHDDGENWHFHGFIGCDESMLSTDGHKDKYGNTCYHLDVYEKTYGWSRLIDTRKVPEWSREKMIRYCVKYSIKQGTNAMYNRKSFVKERTIGWIKNLLGDLVEGL